MVVLVSSLVNYVSLLNPCSKYLRSSQFLSSVCYTTYMHPEDIPKFNTLLRPKAALMQET